MRARPGALLVYHSPWRSNDESRAINCHEMMDARLQALFERISACKRDDYFFGTNAEAGADVIAFRSSLGSCAMRSDTSR
jgi:hypothetical protein